MNKIILTGLLLTLLLIGGCSEIDNWTSQWNSKETKEVTNYTETETNTSLPEITDSIQLNSNYTNAFFIDTEEGMSVLITTNENEAVLIDGGSDSKAVLNLMKDLNITELNYIVVTNSMSSHAGGVDIVAIRRTPEMIYHVGLPSDEVESYSEYANTTNVISKTILPLDGEIIILHPAYEDGFFDSPKDNTIVVEIKNKLLLMSECSEDCEEAVGNLKAEVIQVPRLCDSTSMKYLVKSEPEYVIVPGHGTVCDDLLNTVDVLGFMELNTYYDSEQKGTMQAIFKDDEIEWKFN